MHVLRSVHHRPTAAASNLSFGSGVVVIVSSQAHLTHVSALSGRASGPYPASYPDRPARRAASTRPGFLLPFGHRHSLLGSSCSRRGVGPSSRSAYPASNAPDPVGVSTFHTHEIRPGWVPSLPRGRRCSPDRIALSRPAPAASQRPVLHPAGTSHRRGSPMTRHQRGFTRVHPSGLPLTCSPRMERGPFGFFPELRTPPLPATHAKAGTGIEH